MYIRKQDKHRANADAAHTHAAKGELGHDFGGGRLATAELRSNPHCARAAEAIHACRQHHENIEHCGVRCKRFSPEMARPWSRV